jgi:uncharacterized membrane protein (DUF485 family)
MNSPRVQTNSGVGAGMLKYFKALAVGLASGLVVLWFEVLLLFAFELNGWTAAYVVNGWSILLVGLLAFAIGFYLTVRRGQRSQHGKDRLSGQTWRALYRPAGAFLVCLATGSALNRLLGFELSIADGLATSTVVAVFVGYSTSASTHS